MTYITKGEYSTTDDGYLIGYKLIRSNYRSFFNEKFIYAQGKVAGHRPGELKDRFFFKKWYYSDGDQIHHCCGRDELKKNYWSTYRDKDSGGIRLVRLLIHPDDMIKQGICYRAYVDMISPVMFQWGVFSPEGSLAPDLPPVTELAKKKLNAGLSVDEVISVVMTPETEKTPVDTGATIRSIDYLKSSNFPSNHYYTSIREIND